MKLSVIYDTLHHPTQDVWCTGAPSTSYKGMHTALLTLLFPKVEFHPLIIRTHCVQQLGT